MVAVEFVPSLGVLLSNALYLSSAPAVARAASSGRIGSLNMLPQSLMVLSTFAWMSYGLSVPNAYIVMSNLPGSVAAVAFFVALLPLLPHERARERAQVQCVLVVGAALQVVLWSWLVLSGATHAEIVFALGAYGSAICVVLFASPLSTVQEVLLTRNAASIYAPLTFTQCANCLMWTLYGLGIGDIWVYGPNGLGLGLGVVQLVLKLSYPSTVRLSESEKGLFRKANASDEDSHSEDVA
jgi:solute carrier family 50 protein (sugar transporter)